MYDISSIVISAILFVSMLAAIEIGYRFGLQNQSGISESSKTHINAIQASLLGVLALLIGFTFSLSLQRYDSRTAAVVDEANAIGTTYLRAQLLVSDFDQRAQQLLRDYLEKRIAAGATTLVDQAVRQTLLDEAKHIQSELWTLATELVSADDRPTTSGLFIQSLNELIDNLESRDAALNRHVPEVVLLLLYGTFLMTGSIVGYAAGVAGHRTSYITYIMSGLIVLLVFVIVDLDRPRRGLIEVSQKSLTDLQSTMAAPQQNQ